jgi:hypothetical protein
MVILWFDPSQMMQQEAAGAQECQKQTTAAGHLWHPGRDRRFSCHQRPHPKKATDKRSFAHKDLIKRFCAMHKHAAAKLQTICCRSAHSQCDINLGVSRPPALQVSSKARSFGHIITLLRAWLCVSSNLPCQPGQVDGNNFSLLCETIRLIAHLLKFIEFISSV